MNEDQHDDWNPRDASILQDQGRAYDEMRERCPVARSRFLGWTLFCHDDITAVLADPETFSNVSQFLSIPNGMDPPDHGTYYDVLAAFFDDEHMAQFEPRAREIAATLLEPMHGVIEMEFIDEFATPYALRALCAFLGWPEQQWTCLAGWGAWQPAGSANRGLSRWQGSGRPLRRARPHEPAQAPRFTE